MSLPKSHADGERSPILLEAEPPADAYYNMALDECILDASARTRSAIWRLYLWSPPAVSVGRNQKIQDAVNITSLEESGIDLVRRPTGGRAIWHSGDFCFTSSAPLETGRSTVSAFKDDYLRTSGVLVDILRALGITAEISPGSPTGRSPGGMLKSPCFQSSGRFEITVRGKKIAGISQFVSTGSYLIQGSVRLKPVDSLNRMLFFPSGADGESAFRVLASQVTSIEEETGRSRSMSELDSVLVNVLSSHFRTAVERQPIGKIVESDHVQRLVKEKYRSDEWNRLFSIKQKSVE